MKKLWKHFGIVILTMIIGLFFATCGNPAGGGNGGDAPSTKGRLTITGLEAYNGMYVAATGSSGEGDRTFVAGEDYSGAALNTNELLFVGSKISNGRAVLKVWEVIIPEDFTGYWESKAYSGNDQNIGFGVMIFSKNNFFGGDMHAASGTVYPVNFINGVGSGVCIDIIPVVTVDLGDGITGSLSASHDEGFVAIDFYDHAIATEGNEENYKQDFELYVDGNIIAFSDLYLSEGIGFGYDNTDLLTVGESYSIRIKYTANPSRSIKVWIPEDEDDWDIPPANAATLRSFDTGVKTVIVKE